MSKSYNEKEFIYYRNKVITRAKARRKTFPNDKELNYWEIRLIELNQAYPEYSKLGLINLKEKEK